MPVEINYVKDEKVLIGNGKAEVEVHDKHGQIIESSEQLDDKVLFTEPPLNVGVSLGFTKNTGDYNSLRATVTVNMPCKLEDLDATYEKAKDWVDSKLEELSETIS